MSEIDWAAVRERLERYADTETLPSEDSHRILDERARTLARRSPPLPGAVHELGSFSVGALECLIELRYLLETTRHGEVARVPGTPPYLLGVFALRGAMLPLFELRTLLGEPPPETPLAATAAGGGTGAVLVLGGEEADLGDHGRRPPLGLLVDRLGEPLRLPVEAVHPPPPSLTTRPYLRGITGDGRLLLDGAALLDEPRLHLRGG